MGNLIKPADYAAKMGISRQAVYAKIKKGILTSRNIGGKIFIVLDTKSTAAGSGKQGAGANAKTVSSGQYLSNGEQQEKLLAAKDETIAVLRETITDLKETNQMITSTLRGEVELLKEAFSEMKMLYGLQLEHKVQAAEEGTIEVDSVDTAEVQKWGSTQEMQPPEGETEPISGLEEEWIELSDFYALHKIKKKKKQQRIKAKLKKRLKKGDPRIDRQNGEIVFLASADFEDLLAKV